MTRVSLYKLEKKKIWLFTSGLIVNSQPEVGEGGYRLREYKYSGILIVVNNIQLLTK